MEPWAQRVLAEVEERGVRFVRLWFTDVLGFLKSFAIPSEELEKALTEGVGFDGSSIEGFARLEESDVVARPDPSTFRILPWPEDEPVARMLCDIAHPDGAPFEGDPRWVLRRNLARAAEMGFRLMAGPEVEFFLSRSPERFDPLDRGGYFDMTSARLAERLETRTVQVLERLGVAVEMLHHEGAPGQHEVDLVPDEALAVADALLTVRLAIKEAAQELGLYASFMPKPAEGIEGSGMHVHFRLLEGDRNAFFDPTDEAGLSKVGRSFVAGLLEHAPAITAVTNQWVNSYKRLVPGFEAPAFVTWARQNRSALVRVPADRPADEASCRIEYRSPDPACNPYLAFAVILAAGLDGVRRELTPPPETTDDLNALDEDERRAAGIASLPDSLHDAVRLTERSELVAEALGEHLFEWFIRNKREDWDAYRAQVTPLELDRSFPLL
ncbi:MAG TPA: glutamine synthetase family protein [Actinomycetota bacterium]|nr:glutamine synthetase family protein [Actinomycetota bacterium]